MAKIDNEFIACSFCGKRQDMVERLIAGPDSGIYICNECIEICNEILNNEYEDFDVAEELKDLSALPNSEIMIHQPLGGMQGQATDIKIHADHIIGTKEKLNRILSERTGQPYDKVVADTERDNFLSAPAAKEYGLIDEVIEKRK